MMKVGHLKEKAHPFLVGFVFSCILIATGLLYILQKSEAKADELTSLYANTDEYLQ